MMRLICSIIVCFAMLGLSPWGALSLRAAAKSSKPILVVFDIEVKILKLKGEVVAVLSEYLSAQLTASGAFQLIPRDQLKQRLVSQKKASYKSCFDQSCQIEIGRELAANKSLSAQILKIGGGCVVTATLHDLRQAITEQAATATGACTEQGLLKSISAVVGKLAQTRASTPEPVSAVKGPVVRIPGGAGKAPFLIDQYEVSVGHYNACARAKVCKPLFHKQPKAALPVRNITWSEARVYCQFVSMRLPYEWEWERAAQGPKGTRYPWGDKAQCSRATLSCGGHMEPGPADAQRKDRSKEGVYGLSGNVSEWVTDWFNVVRARSLTGPSSGVKRVVRGGSFMTGLKQATSRFRFGLPPQKNVPDIGFRCAAAVDSE